MLREWLFDAVSRRFIADVPVGWRFGPAELDPKAHAILKADLDKETAGLLRLGRLLVKTLGNFIGGNTWAAADFEPAPASDWHYPRTFINFRSGRQDTGEEDAWANAREGDIIYVTKAPDRENALGGYAFKVIDPKARRAEGRERLTRKEAEAWQAS